MIHSQEDTIMKCPVCDESLREVQKHGVSIDICPGCKGIWLDRGELEKILELATTNGPVSETRSDQARPQQVFEEPRRSFNGHNDHDNHDKRDHDKREHDDHGREQSYDQKKKKSSWLGDILGGLGGD
jgi:Zn-finger nucleic acid-binding protein